MTREKCLEILSSMIAPPRFEHTLGVEKCAIELAEVYEIDKDKAGKAAILHDCAKECKYGLRAFCEKYNLVDVYEHFSGVDISLIHAPLGVIVAQRIFEETDQEILDAVEWHTTGRTGMTVLEKIVYLSDAIEPGRGDSPEVTRIRSLVKTNLNYATLCGMNMAIKNVMAKNKPLDKYTIDARNDLLSIIMDEKPHLLELDNIHIK